MISIGIEGLEDLKKSLDPKVFENVFRTTANEITVGAFSKARTAIKKKWDVAIKKEGKEFAFANKRTGKTNKRNGRMKIIRASRSNGSLITIDIVGTPLNLSLFEFTWKNEVDSKKNFNAKRRVYKKKHKLTKRQRQRVRVKIRRGQITTLKSAFVATMKSGHTGIFQRSTKAILPILEKRSITPVSMFEQVNFDSIINKDFDDKLEKRFNHNLERKTGGWY